MVLYVQAPMPEMLNFKVICTIVSRGGGKRKVVAALVTNLGMTKVPYF
jgi:hypothetical protein